MSQPILDIGQQSTCARITVIGKFTITISDRTVIPPTRRLTQHLLVMLLLARTPTDRMEAAALLWPGYVDSRARAAFRRHLQDLDEYLERELPGILMIRRWTRTVQMSIGLQCRLDINELQSLADIIEQGNAIEAMQAVERAAKEPWLHADLLSDWSPEWLTVYRGLVRSLQHFISDWVSSRTENNQDLGAEISRIDETVQGCGPELKHCIPGAIPATSDLWPVVEATADNHTTHHAKHRPDELNWHGDLSSQIHNEATSTATNRSPILGAPNLRRYWHHSPAVHHPMLGMPLSLDASVRRDLELEKLHAALEIGRTVVICGPIGIGKSRLTAEYLHHRMPRHQQRICWISGAARVEQLLQNVASSVLEWRIRDTNGNPSDSCGGCAGNPDDLTNDVLVLDGCDNMSAQTLPHLRWLSNAYPTTTLIVITRRHDLCEFGASVVISGLNEPRSCVTTSASLMAHHGAVGSALTLLNTRLAEFGSTSGLDEDAFSAAAICGETCYVPLAIEWYSWSMIALSGTEMMDYLATGSILFGIESNLSPAASDVHTSLIAAWRSLSPDGRIALHGVSLYSHTFCVDAASYVCVGLRSEFGETSNFSDDILELLNAGWIQPETDSEYSIPFLQRNFLPFVDPLGAPTEATRHRFVESCLLRARQIMQECGDSAESEFDDAMDRCCDDVMKSLSETSSKYEDIFEVAIQVVEGLWRYWTRKSMLPAALLVAERILLDAEWRGDLEQAGRISDVVGMIRYAQGNIGAASNACARSVCLFRVLKNAERLSMSLIHLAGIRAMSGDVSSSHAIAMESVELVTVLANRLQILEIFGLAADICLRGGFSDDADVILSNAREIIGIETGSPRRSCRICLRLGTVAMERGEYGLAARLLEDAAQQAGFVLGGRELGRVLAELALVRRWQGLHGEALSLLMSVIRSSFETRDHLLHVTCLCNLADMWCDEMRWSEAKLAIQRIRNYKNDRIPSDIELDMLNIELMIAYYCQDHAQTTEMAIVVEGLVNDETEVVSKGWAWRTLATIAQFSGDHVRAAKWAQRSIEHFYAIGNVGGVIRSLEAAGEVLMKGGFPEAGLQILVASSLERTRVGAPRTLREEGDFHRCVRGMEVNYERMLIELDVPDKAVCRLRDSTDVAVNSLSAIWI